MYWGPYPDQQCALVTPPVSGGGSRTGVANLSTLAFNRCVAEGTSAGETWQLCQDLNAGLLGPRLSVYPLHGMLHPQHNHLCSWLYYPSVILHFKVVPDWQLEMECNSSLAVFQKEMGENGSRDRKLSWYIPSCMYERNVRKTWNTDNTEYVMEHCSTSYSKVVSGIMDYML